MARHKAGPELEQVQGQERGQEQKGRGGLAGRTRRRWGKAATAVLGLAMCLAIAPVGHAIEGTRGAASDSGRPSPPPSPAPGGKKWTSRDAAAYWTAKRMAAAAPARSEDPSGQSADGSAGDGASGQSDTVSPGEDTTSGGDTPGQSAGASAGDGAPGLPDTVSPGEGTTSGGDSPGQSTDAPSGDGDGRPGQSGHAGHSDAPSAGTDTPGRPGTTPPAAGSPAKPHAASQPHASARHFDGVPSVGVLFSVDKDARAHHCTASVVHSPQGNLILTAGHCDLGSRAAFVPQYRSGAATQPYGVWAITETFAYPDRGTTGPKSDLDFAFATVAPSVEGRSLEEVTGGNVLAQTPGYANDVTVIGYPTVRHDPADQAVRCAARTARLAGTRQLRVDCSGFYGGTSGGPWLADFDEATGTGRIIGLIGGLHGGGPKGRDNHRVSYSPYFGEKILSLYTRATRASAGAPKN